MWKNSIDLIRAASWRRINTVTVLECYFTVKDKYNREGTPTKMQEHSAHKLKISGACVYMSD